MKKTLSMILALLMLVSLLTACGGIAPLVYSFTLLANIFAASI